MWNGASSNLDSSSDESEVYTKKVAMGYPAQAVVI
jgi:hypothetical protein